MYVGYSNEWPSVAVTFSYSCKPCGFCGKTCCGMEIPDGLFDAGEFINIENGVLLLFHGGLQVVMDGLCGWHNISCIKRFRATWRVQDEGVFIVIAINVTQWDTPESSMRALITLEDGCGINVYYVGVVEVHFILVVDCCGPRISKFATTE